MAAITAAAVIGSLLAPVSAAVAAPGPDFSRKWSPQHTPLPKTPGVKGAEAAREKAPAPAHPVPATWQPAKSRPAAPHGRASVTLGAAPAKPTAPADAESASGVESASGAESTAAGLPVSLAPLAGSAAAGQTVQVEVADTGSTSAAGIPGLAMTLTRTVKGDAAPVRVGVDLAALAPAFGADWAGRAQVVALPNCALSAPRTAGCLDRRPVPSHVEPGTGKLVADVVLPADDGAVHTGVQALSAASAAASMTLAVVSGASSGAGSYAATPLNPSQAWSAGGSSGAFTYSYPLAVPPALGGSAPSVALGYDSASVDGKTSSTNAQASWIGDGWDYGAGFVERSYKPCSKAGITNSGDVCWAGANLTLSLAGHSGELVPDDASCQSGAAATLEQSNCTWRLKDDDATKVQFLTGATNGTWNGSYLKVTDTTGTVYYFGLNHLPDASGNPSTKGADSGSAWTVPVYSPNAGDPCYDAAKGKSSWCQAAWRWNLDYVVDPHGNLTTYTYTPETNSYSRGGAQNNGTGTLTQYTRGGVLQSIGYGQLLSDQIAANGAYNPAAKVVFSSGERCVTSTLACDPVNRTTAHAGDWPDVPLDQQCASTGTCTVYGPTFWTTKWLSSVTTQVRSGGAYRDVDSYALTHTFVNVQNATENTQVPWLASVQRTGKDSQGGGSAVTLPPVSFTAMLLPNRVDGTNLVPSRPAYNRPRIQLITTETGSTIGVDYKAADCSRVTNVMPASADSDTRSCYNVKWHVPNEAQGAQPVDDWFLRYPVSTVTSSPNTPGAAPITTAYSYGNAAWHRNDSQLTESTDRTWDQFRGYASVTTVTGNGNDGPKSQKSATYYQGMDGDYKADGTTRSVSVAGPMSGQVTDSDWLSGQALETDTWTQAGGTITAYTVSTATGPVTTATHNRAGLPALLARYTATSSSAVTKSLKADGSWRSAGKTTGTDSGHGNRITTSLDTADGLPDICTRTGYAAGADPQVLAVPSETVVVSGANACTATPDAGNTVGWSRTLYDGKAFGLLGTALDPTSSLTIDHYSGTTPQFTTHTAAFDGYGRPTAATDPNATDNAHPGGAVVTTGYTPAQAGELPTSTTVTTPAPDGAADVAAGRTTTTTMDPARGLPTSVTDPNGRVTTEAYDQLGRLTSVWMPGRTAPATANQTFAYSVPGVVNGVVVPATVTSSQLRTDGSYALSVQIMDGMGRAIQTQASPAASAYTGRMISDVAYDSHGRVIRSNSSWYEPTTGPSGALYQTTTNQVPAQSHTVFDGLGRAVTTELLAYGTVQSSTTTAYPGADRTDVTPPVGATPTSTVVDARGRSAQLWEYRTPTATGNPADADVTTYTYGADGNLATQKDAAGNTWTHGYDLSGHETASTDPDTGSSSRKYDAAGRVASSTDARGRTVAFSYDLLGRTTGSYDGTVSAATQLTGFTYDTVLKGLPATSTRYVGGAGGSAYTSAVLSYDTAYHPTKTTVTIPGSEVGTGSTPFSYTYQASYDPITGALKADNRSAVGDIAAETVTYSYDVNGPLSSFGAFGGSTYDLSSDYDAYGRNIRSTMNPWGTQVVVTNTYDNTTGRPLQQFVDKQTAATGAVQQTTYAYNAAGQVTAVRSIPDNVPANTDLQCFGYDYLGRLTTAWSDTGTLALQAQPTVGNQGGCANATPTSGVTAPAKTTVGGPGAYWQTYGYDLTGNRKQFVQHDPAGDTTKDTTVTQTFQPAGTVNTRTTASNTGGGTGGPHALIGSTTTGPAGTTSSNSQYDEAGNTTAVTDTSGTAALTWDGESKLTSYNKTGSTGATTFLYDASGQQLIRRDPGRTTITLGGDELVYDTNARTTTGVRYYQIPGGTTLVRQGGKSTYQIGDLHGTGTLALDATTLAESRRLTDPFGNPRGTQPTGWAGDRGYVGGSKDDATGLTNLGAREYQPATGRFLSPDPVIGLGNPQQWNAYAYSNNDPVGSSDPTGRYTCRNGHEGCDEHGNACGGNCSADATMVGDCVETECGHSEINQNPDHTIEEQKQARLKKILKQLDDYQNKRVCKGLGKGTRCQSQEGWDRDNASSAAFWSGIGDMTFVVPWARCTFQHDDHECDVAGTAASTMDLGGIAVGTEEAGAAYLSALLTRAASKDTPPVLKKILQALAGLCQANSFPGDTRVQLADGGSKPIEEVEVGDTVLATDPLTGRTSAEKVTAVVTTPTDADFTDLTVATPAGDRTLTSTRHHPYWDRSTQRWTDAADLKAGEELQQPDGAVVRIAEVRSYTKPVFTYNLTVDQLHTYYVLAGPTAVLVHNAPANCKMSNTIGKLADGRFGDILTKWFPTSKIESQFPIWTPYGVREADYAVADGKGGYQLYEVKANGSRYTAIQRKKDAWIAQNLGWQTTVIRMSQPCPSGC
ncbi:polymorphic toxin-type HINT domain-containing protein [Kitasatospora sp. NPDC088134]|uniref:polymorphic toxin-type HINT domain-containing protein n=1 Tax=Kitasatospora sp. NPDC088134 TaxID=3364071 RepID=UPI00381F9DDF